MDFFIPADEAHVKREKTRARDLRSSQWWKNQKGHARCHYCQAQVHPSELTMDHVVPIVRGGKTTKGNVVPACKPCNDNKKYLLPIEWQEYLDSLSKPSTDS
ncbi:MAG TPA: HNH endonuclease [Lentisphaeria bacterium]|nr:HNH endonuclease [Lentisphaeria bacterium]